jgi:hypothetical protein
VLQGTIPNQRGVPVVQEWVAVRFADHERFVEEVMTIEPAPYLKLVAVLHRDSS